MGRIKAPEALAKLKEAKQLQEQLSGGGGGSGTPAAAAAGGNRPVDTGGGGRNPRRSAGSAAAAASGAGVAFNSDLRANELEVQGRGSTPRWARSERARKLENRRETKRAGRREVCGLRRGPGQADPRQVPQESVSATPELKEKHCVFICLRRDPRWPCGDACSRAERRKTFRRSHPGGDVQ